MGKNNDEDIPCVIPVGRAARADLIPRLLAVNFCCMQLSATSNKTLTLIMEGPDYKGHGDDRKLSIIPPFYNKGGKKGHLEVCKDSPGVDSF